MAEKTLAEKLQIIRQAKADIKQAVIEKGLTDATNEFEQYVRFLETLGIAVNGNIEFGNISGDTFGVAQSFKTIIFDDNGHGFDNITNLNKAFENSSSLQELDLSKFNNAKNMTLALNQCSNITKVILPNTLNNLTTIAYCFQSCEKLTEVIFPEEIPLLTNGSYMFNYTEKYNCTSLPKMPNIKSLAACFAFNNSISEFTFGEYPLINDLRVMFQNSTIGKITFNPSMTQPIDFANFVSTCKNLTIIEFPTYITIKNAISLLSNCSNLTKIILHDLTSAESMRSMFNNCTSLIDLHVDALPSYNLTDVGFETCVELNVESLNRIIEALPNTTSLRFLTLGSNKDKLTEEKISEAQSKNWTIN